MTGATMVTYRQVDSPRGDKQAQNIDAGLEPAAGRPAAVLATREGEGGEAPAPRLARQLIREFKSAPAETDPMAAKKESPPADRTRWHGPAAADEGAKVPVEAGLNRFVWKCVSRRCEIEGEGGTWEAFENSSSPAVAPGTYRARLTVGGETLETSFRSARTRGRGVA